MMVALDAALERHGGVLYCKLHPSDQTCLPPLGGLNATPVDKLGAVYGDLDVSTLPKVGIFRTIFSIRPYERVRRRSYRGGAVSRRGNANGVLDIGAFERREFTITAVPGGNNQRTLIDTHALAPSASETVAFSAWL